MAQYTSTGPIILKITTINWELWWKYCFKILFLSDLYTQGGAWTPNPKNKSFMPYWLSQTGNLMMEKKIKKLPESYGSEKRQIYSGVELKLEKRTNNKILEYK